MNVARAPFELIARRHITYGAVQPLLVVMVHVPARDQARLLHRTRIFLPDALPLQRSLHTLLLAVRLRIIRARPNVSHPRQADELPEIAGDELRTVVADQLGPDSGKSLQRPLHDQLHVRLLHRFAYIPLHDEAAESVEHAAQIVECAAYIEVSHVDMPLLVRALRLYEARALLRRSGRTRKQKPRILQDAIHRGRRAGHHIGIDHHVGQAPVSLARMQDEEIDNRQPFPLFQPPVARNLAVVFVGHPEALPPPVELRPRQAQPLYQADDTDLRAIVEAIYEIDDLIARVELGPPTLQPRPSFFLSATHSSATSAITSSLWAILFSSASTCRASALSTITPLGLTYTPDADLGEGGCSVELLIADNCGNTAGTIWNFVIDSQCPEFVEGSLYPEPLGAVGGTAPYVSASYFDLTSGINAAAVTVSIDGQDITPQATISQWDISVEAGGLAEGQHNVQVNIADTVGHAGTTNWSFEVDLTPPSEPVLLSYAAPDGGEIKPVSPDTEELIINTQRVALRLHTDPDAGMPYIYLSEGDLGDTLAGDPGVTAATEPGDWDVLLTNLPDAGSDVHLTATSEDLAGNASSKVFTIHIVRTPGDPDAPGGGLNFDYCFDFTAGGSVVKLTGSGFTSITTVSIGGTPCQVNYKSESEIYVIVPGLTPGFKDVCVANGEFAVTKTNGFEMLNEFSFDFADLPEMNLSAGDVKLSGKITGGKAPYTVTAVIHGENESKEIAVADAGTTADGRLYDTEISVYSGFNHCFVKVEDIYGNLAVKRFAHEKDDSDPMPPAWVNIYPTDGGAMLHIGPSGSLDAEKYEVVYPMADGGNTSRIVEAPENGVLVYNISGMTNGEEATVNVYSIDRVDNKSVNSIEKKITPMPFGDLHSAKKAIEEKRLMTWGNPENYQPCAYSALGTIEDLQQVRSAISGLPTTYEYGGKTRNHLVLEDAAGNNGYYTGGYWDAIDLPDEPWTDTEYNYITQPAINQIALMLAKTTLWTSPKEDDYHIVNFYTWECTIDTGLDDRGWTRLINFVNSVPTDQWFTRRLNLLDTWINPRHGSAIWGQYRKMVYTSYSFEFWQIEAGMYNTYGTIFYEYSPNVEQYYWADHGVGKNPDNFWHFNYEEKALPQYPLNPADNIIYSGWDNDGYEDYYYEYGITASCVDYGECLENIYRKNGSRPLAPVAVSISPQKFVIALGTSASFNASVFYHCDGWGAGNGHHEEWEPFTDLNNNGIWDNPEPFHDHDFDGDGDIDTTDGAGQWYAGDRLTVDRNHNGIYEPNMGDEFEDLNGNEEYDEAECFVDYNGNGVCDWQVTPEPFRGHRR